MKAGKTWNASALHYLLAAAGRYNWGILGLCLVNIGLSALSLSYALALRSIVNAAVAANSLLFWKEVGVFAAIVIAQLLLRCIYRYASELIKAQVENRLKLSLCKDLLAGEYQLVKSVHSGEWINRFSSDCLIAANGLCEILPGFLGMLVQLAGAAAIILVLEPRFLYLVIPAGLAMLVLSTSFRKKMKSMHKAIQQASGRVRIAFQEMLASLLVVRSYAVESLMEENLSEKMEVHKKARLKRALFSDICNLGFGAVMNGAYVLGALFCGMGILNGTMSYGNFMAVLQLISQIQSPFANISGYLPRYYSMIASTERLMELHAQMAEPASVEVLNEDAIQNLYEKDVRGIEISHLTFTYPDIEDNSSLSDLHYSSNPVLEDVSVSIAKNSTVALMGPSGCGKSTFLKALMPVFTLPAGVRSLLLKNEKTELDARYQKLFAYVPQGNILLTGTVRDVITMVRPQASGDDAAIWQALKAACADEFVAQLPEQLDSLLMEQGTGLSEGQMQRIAIARAIFSQAPVLLLDECTSALDEKTEQAVLRNLRQLKNKTILIVTHRSAPVSLCDSILHFHETGFSIEKKGEAYD